jgi:hypothetical protein
MLAGFILWLMAPFLANLAARDTSQIANAVGLTVQDLTQSAFVVVGVFIFVMTLPDLIRSFVIYADRPGSLEISYGLALLLRCLLAVALVLGARWAARTLLWIRYARTSK